MKDLLKTLSGPIRLVLSLLAILTFSVGLGVTYADGKNGRENNQKAIQVNKAAIIKHDCDDEKQMVILHRIDKRQTVIMQKMGITVPD